MSPNPSARRVVAVSACLLGERCRFDGRDKLDRDLVERLRAEGAEIVPICPEVLGGLGTPRPAAEIRGGDGEDVLDGRARVVVVATGKDVTREFLVGAEAALAAARAAGATEAVLKERSPSCGPTEVHRDGGPKPGLGVAAALFRRAGLRVIAR